MSGLIASSDADEGVDRPRQQTTDETAVESEPSTSSDESESEPGAPHASAAFDDVDPDLQITPVTTLDGLTPGPAWPGTSATSYADWTIDDPPTLPFRQLSSASVTAPAPSQPQSRPREGSMATVAFAGVPDLPDTPAKGSLAWPPRPGGPARTPSHTYAPARVPSQYPSAVVGPHRGTTGARARRDPNAQYRAQEKAYVQRIRQPANDYFAAEPYSPSVTYSGGSDTGEESPSSEALVEHDGYDQDVALYYGNDEMRPSWEELKIPANRERLEWHSMLASVLTGDVVKQEKKRLIGAGGLQDESTLWAEVWLGVRAKVCGRTLPAQRRLVDDGRAALDPVIESIIGFQVKGETEAGRPPAQQVRDIVDQIERAESLYPTRLALELAKPRAASDAYQASADAVIAWHATTELINTELDILQRWVGHADLDLTRPPDVVPTTAGLGDDASFLDRVLREDGLRSLQGKHSMLRGLTLVIRKAKATLIQNAAAFAARHLPPYIEELLTLINFPSRLIEEVIQIRLSYARKMKDLALQGAMMVEPMIAQFQILLRLAVVIKQEYTQVAQPEPGWDLPPCIDEDFDRHVLEALKFYFQMLNAKLSGNKNTFKEAEILEQEWDFSNEIGRHLDGGDVEVAEQFSSLTSKALSRLAGHFEKELQRRPNESAAEMDRRYKQNLDSVRVRQRKLFRFSRLLGQRFENATEYGLRPEQVRELADVLIESGHLLVQTPAGAPPDGVVMIAAPTLYQRPGDVQSILGTCYHADDAQEDPSHPYVLLLRPGEAPPWDGRTMALGARPAPTDVKPGRVRLVADGSQARLAGARLALGQATGMSLDVMTEQRANLPRVYAELMRIKKTAYRLSNTIMDSVAMLRRQTAGLACQELIQTCFAFATEFGQRSLLFLDDNRRGMHQLKLTRLALDWVSFICDDCQASDRKTFRWAVIALEFAMGMTRGANLLSLSDADYGRLRAKVGGCMSLLISHFDIMGARSSLAAQVESQRMAALSSPAGQMDRSRDDAASAAYVRAQWLARLAEIEAVRRQRDADRQPLGRVLEDANEADRSLTYLSASATNVTLRWQQGQFIGGGTFGSVYVAINLDSGYLMAVKEIRLQDPQLIPTIAQQIRDEMGVLEVLDHPNVVSYYGIEVHRDKVFIFMEYCSGGSLAGLLEHGRIEDETVIQVYALQLLEGLAYLHEAGVVHRDIKPENILLDHQGVIKYVDFGAAKIIARQGKTIGGEHHASTSSTPRSPTAGHGTSMTGTPMYMSPEAIKGHGDGRLGAVDVWSLGCVILEMATGRRPWASLDNEWAIMYNIAQGNTPQLASRDQLSESGLDFLKRCFIRDPARRSSAAELLQHEWILAIKNQVALDASTPSSDSASLASLSLTSSLRSSSFSPSDR
ncbi:MAG: Suppressor of Sensor Kinase (SLN1) [Phylliscum demangeonii]|nr:MAG: Suppressor of Sensor Kinase (SLN1) [Phylliscum demangeonii]